MGGECTTPPPLSRHLFSTIKNFFNYLEIFTRGEAIPTNLQSSLCVDMGFGWCASVPDSIGTSPDVGSVGVGTGFGLASGTAGVLIENGTTSNERQSMQPRAVAVARLDSRAAELRATGDDEMAGISLALRSVPLHAPAFTPHIFYRQAPFPFEEI